MASRRRRKGLSFYARKEKMKPSTWKEIFSYIFWMFTVSFLAFVLVLAFGMRTSVIGVSMEPTLCNSQEVFINKLAYLVLSPGRGDVVVFQPNGNENAHYYVKRIIGLPGETVQIRGGQVYIDGEKLEGYEFDKIETAGLAETPYLLGDDEYFVLGDNRNNSEDSRSGNIGVVHRDYIVGQAWFCLAKENVGMGFVK